MSCSLGELESTGIPERTKVEVTRLCDGLIAQEMSMSVCVWIAKAGSGGEDWR